MALWGRLIPFNERYNDVDLEHDVTWLGRGNECHPETRYTHIDISRKHCLISLEEDDNGDIGVYVTDNSSNGTWLNGIQLEYGVKYPMKDKDKLTLAVQSIKAPEWDADSIGYSFFDLRTRGKKAVASSTAYSYGVGRQGELATERHLGEAPAKKKKKKKKKAAVEVEAVVPEPEPEVPTAPKTKPSPKRVEEEAEPEPVKPKAKLSAKKAIPKVEAEEEEEGEEEDQPKRPQSASGPLTRPPLSPGKPSATASKSTPGIGSEETLDDRPPLKKAESKSIATTPKPSPSPKGPVRSNSKAASEFKSVSEEALEARAKPKFGKTPIYQPTQIELESSSSEDEDEDDAPAPAPTSSSTRETPPAKRAPEPLTRTSSSSKLQQPLKSPDSPLTRAVSSMLPSDYRKTPADAKPKSPAPKSALSGSNLSTSSPSEDLLEARAKPKIGLKGALPKFEPTTIELASSSDEEEEDDDDDDDDQDWLQSKPKAPKSSQPSPRPKSVSLPLRKEDIEEEEDDWLSSKGPTLAKSPLSASQTSEEEDEEETIVVEEEEPPAPTPSVVVAKPKRSTTRKSCLVGTLKEKTQLLMEERRLERLREDPPISADYLRKVTLIQCLWLRRCAMRQYKIELRRKNIAREMLTTERVYVKHLRAGLHEYALPLKEQLTSAKKKPIITMEQYDKMFGDYEKIYEYNARLLAVLEPRVEKWNPEQCIGDIFVSITASQTRAFRDIYASYIVCYDSAGRMFDRISAANNAFVSFVKEKESSGKAQSILSCLIMPVQRLPRYKLLLMDLLKYTHPQHPDYKNLDQACKNIHEMTEYIDGAKDKADKLYKMFGTITPDKPAGPPKKKKSRPMSAMFLPLKHNG